MAALVGIVSAAAAALFVFLALVAWSAIGLAHSGMFGLFLVFAAVYGLGVLAGSMAGLLLVRSRAGELSEARVRGLVVVAVVAATAGSAGYFIGWFTGVLPSPA